MNILSFLSSIHHRLFGSKELLPYEQLCLDAWRATLNKSSQKTLDEQLATIQFIQRQAGGAKICFFGAEDVFPPLFSDTSPNLHAATVILKTPDEKKMRAKIFTQRGKFFSIEFPKRPERYIQQNEIKAPLLQIAEVINQVEL